MKPTCGRFAVGLAQASVVLVLVVAANAGAQNAQANRFEEASSAVRPLIEKAGKDGFKFGEGRQAVSGSWVKQGSERWVKVLTLKMVPGKTYRLMAAGDKGALDVDLQVLD